MTLEEIKAIGFKGLKLEHMISFIEENFKNDAEGLAKAKKDFKENALLTYKKTKKGKETGEEGTKYSHLEAVRYFCGTYAKDMLPERKEPKVPVALNLKDW